MQNAYCNQKGRTLQASCGHEFLVVHEELIHKNQYTNSLHAKGWAHHDHDATSGYIIYIYSQHHPFHWDYSCPMLPSAESCKRERERAPKITKSSSMEVLSKHFRHVFFSTRSCTNPGLIFEPQRFHRCRKTKTSSYHSAPQRYR